MADPLSYFLFQPVLHNWCNKGHSMCNPVSFTHPSIHPASQHTHPLTHPSINPSSQSTHPPFLPTSDIRPLCVINNSPLMTFSFFFCDSFSTSFWSTKSGGELKSVVTNCDSPLTSVLDDTSSSAAADPRLMLLKMSTLRPTLLVLEFIYHIKLLKLYTSWMVYRCIHQLFQSVFHINCWLYMLYRLSIFIYYIKLLKFYTI